MTDEERELRSRRARVTAGVVMIDSVLEDITLDEFRVLQPLLQDCIDRGRECVRADETMTPLQVYIFECACDRLFVALFHLRIKCDSARDP